MTINYAALKTELQTNPANIGDGTTLTQHAQAGQFQSCADLLNAVGTGTVTTGVLPVPVFQGAVVAAELMTLTQAQRADLASFLQEYQDLYGGIPLNDPGTWGSIIPAFFPANAPLQAGYTKNTYQTLQTLKTRNCSRAETLFGAGTTLTWQDIAIAWNGG